MATKKNITVNGVLTQVWQTDATAQAIDDAVVAAQNAVRYTAQSKTAAEQAQARGNIGAAPDGYGLGGYATQLPGMSCNEAVYNGWYINQGSDNENCPKNGDVALSYGTLLVSAKSYTNVMQFYFPAISNFTGYCIRTSDGTTWTPWEWPNPPMQLGVEYRTTERYLGKPIYCKVVDCGNLPNAGRKAVSIGVSGLEKVIDVSGCAIDASNNDFYSIPVTDFNSSVHNVGLYATGSQTIVMTTQSDRSMYNAYVKVRYTKTTD